MKRSTRLFSIVLVFAMFFSMFPEMTFVMGTENVKAEAVSEDDWEDFGEPATWSFDAETGTLTYSGGTYVESYGCEDYADEVKKIVFEESIEEVYSDYEGVAFKNLEEVVIPASLTYFSADIISYSSKLTTITVAEDNEVYYTSDGNLYAHYKYEWEDIVEEYYALIKYIPTKTDKVYIVPEGINDISYYAFTKVTDLEEIILPETLEYLYLDSLAEISSLKKITILNPDTELEIEDITYFEDIEICGYENSYVEKAVNEYGLNFQAMPERKIKSISLNTYPYKMEYYMGSDFRSEGLILEVEYEDGGIAKRTRGYEISGFDSSQIGECEVTVSLGGASATFTVEIVGLDAEKIIDIGIDKEVTLEKGEDYEELYFTPQLSGEYMFYTKCSYDTMCNLYDINDELLEWADDSEDEDDLNFNLAYELESGKTYILRVGTYEETGCTFKVKSKLISSDEPHTEHNHISYVTEATEGKDAYTEYICNICGDKYVEYVHEYEKTVIQPTCTKKGFTIHVCKNCEDAYSDNEVPALNHNYVETIIKPATTTSEGEKQYKCSACGDSYTESIAKLKEEPTTNKEITTVKKPGKVKKLKAKVSGKKVKLSWKKINKVSGYEVRIGTGKKVKKAVKKFVKMNKLTYKKLKKKTYYYKVRAYKTVNGKKVYGKWSKAKKFVVK